MASTVTILLLQAVKASESESDEYDLLPRQGVYTTDKETTPTNMHPPDGVYGNQLDACIDEFLLRMDSDEPVGRNSVGDRPTQPLQTCDVAGFQKVSNVRFPGPLLINSCMNSLFIKEYTCRDLTGACALHV